LKTFKLIVSTPDGNVFDGEVLEISVRGSEGSLAVRAGHIPFICTTKEDKIRITNAEADDLFAQAGDGILTVTQEKVTLLCGKFEMVEQ
jgi:F-type H+-transporting ATPase subunit epsilon